MTMEGKHWAIIAAMIMAIGTEISGLQHGWHDATTPQYVGGLLVQVASTLGALFVGSPLKNGQ